MIILHKQHSRTRTPKIKGACTLSFLAHILRAEKKKVILEKSDLRLHQVKGETNKQRHSYDAKIDKMPHGYERLKIHLGRECDIRSRKESQI